MNCLKQGWYVNTTANRKKWKYFFNFCGMFEVIDHIFFLIFSNEHTFLTSNRILPASQLR